MLISTPIGDLNTFENRGLCLQCCIMRVDEARTHSQVALARCSQKILTVLLDYQELEAAHIESSGCQYKIIDHIIVMHWRDKETNVSDMNALER